MKTNIMIMKSFNMESPPFVHNVTKILFILVNLTEKFVNTT